MSNNRQKSSHLASQTSQQTASNSTQAASQQAQATSQANPSQFSSSGATAPSQSNQAQRDNQAFQSAMFTSSNLPSQIEATYSTLQLPISVSSAHGATGMPATGPGSQSSSMLSVAQNPHSSSAGANAMCQSIAYRAENSTQFSRAKAILWEVKFIVSGLNSKKCMPQAQNDVQQLAEQFGNDFDKYLIRELLEQIDLKDANKPSRDRTETFKVQFMNEELKRICAERTDFLTYFDELSRGIFGDGRSKEFHKEICTRLKLSSKMGLLIALSLHESALTEQDRQDAASIVKQKLIEYQASGTNKAEALEEYALHRLLYIFRSYPEFEGESSSPQFEAAKRFLVDHHQVKPSQNVALRLQIADADLISQNPTLEDPANSLLRHGSGLSHLPQINKLLEPWEVLIDLGHYSSVNYQTLTMALQDFKDINEKTMANMLLHLSINCSGQDDLNSRIVFNLFEANKTGDSAPIQKDPNFKNTQMQWHVAHFSRAFRENYSNLNWTRVLDAFTELPDDSNVNSLAQQFDQKSYSFFLQLFTKSKPQNLQVSISLLVEQHWKNPSLQLRFLHNSMQAYISNEDKTTFNYSKCARRIGSIQEIQSQQASQDVVPQSMIDVWSSPEVLQTLLYLSETRCFSKVRQVLDQPVQQCPQYLLLALSSVHGDSGSILLDELVSILVNQQIESHPASTHVLKRLWDCNQPLMIRAICELCSNHQDQVASSNLNKVLDITQDIKDSLPKFVNCQDFDFAVALGIIAGKRDYLNYDAWMRERTQTVGNKFLLSLVRYLYENVFKPINEQLTKSSINLQILASTTGQPQTQEEEKANQILENTLEKAHLTKTHLSLTIEILQSQPSIMQPSPHDISEDSRIVQALVQQISQLTPQKQSFQQQTDMEKAANQFFEQVFNAESNVVEQRISEFINKIRALSSSQVQRDRDILYCILNTFYEEYRFILSFRDRKNLISFAKLFGGIINKNIIEVTLMEISIKFIIQALANNDNRLIFGIEALKQSYQCLSDFPRQFKEIYSQYEQKIKEHDPKFHQQLVQFYNQTFNHQPTRSINFDPDDIKSESAAHIGGSSTKQNFGKEASDIKSESNFRDTEDQKIMPAKQKDRGESQKAKTAQQRDSFQNLNQQKQSGKNQSAINEKRRSPDHPTAQQLNQQQQKVEKEDKQFGNNISAFGQPTGSVLPGALNIQSEAFNRMPEKSAPQPELGKKSSIAINVNASTFNPTEIAPLEPPTKAYTQTAEVQTWQENIDRKIQEAKTKRTEVRLEDIIEDPLLKQISFDSQKEIRFICNNTGTSTFDDQLKKAQNLLSGANSEVSLNWFLHYFLVQRLLGVPQLNIYIELFKKLGNTNVVSLSIKLSVDILKRVVLIPEEEFNKVVKRTQSNVIIKKFVQDLGTFIGILTLASNRPIYNSEVDLKQLLMESYIHQKKYVIFFVCRILKEAPKSQLQIFNRTNPWIVSLLEILREIYDPQKPNEEIQSEIQVLFKEFGLALHEFPTTGFLKARMTNQLITAHQQAEAIYYDKKEMIIPMRVQSQTDSQQASQGRAADGEKSQRNTFEPNANDEYDHGLTRHNNQNQIFNQVSITPNPLFRVFKISENDYRRVISEALESSIKEILPPVVTRSVSIALITTKQLVLKDFTYDSDIKKVTEAITQFAKNAAGSLALVTCREPLRIALKEYVKKEIEACCFKAGTKDFIQNGDELRAKDQSEATLAEADEMDARMSQFIAEHEDMISEVANGTSQENLELGCNIIKSTVFDDTAKRIWQDEEIQNAMEKRRQANQRGEPFVDKQHVANFADLPEVLRPNINGLTQGQLRVYSDFSRLNQLNREDASVPGNLKLNLSSNNFQTVADRSSSSKLGSDQLQKIKEPTAHAFTLETILADIEKAGQLTTFTRALLTLKLSELVQHNSQTEQQAQKRYQEAQKSLWRYIEKKFYDVQNWFDSAMAPETFPQVMANIDIIVMIIKKLTCEDFSKRLLNQVFLNLESQSQFNVELNMTLIQKSILPLADWDKQMSLIIKNAPGNLHEKVVKFLVNFIEKAILHKKIQNLSFDKIPHLVEQAKALTFGSDQQSQVLKSQLNSVLEQLSSQEPTLFQQQCKEQFLMWVDLSYITDTAEQETEVNRFFSDLFNFLQISRDQSKLHEFCNVSIRTSIDFCRQNQNGELRENNALLNYQFIDSFVKLIVLLLNASEFNKQEFMGKIFEFIKVKLGEDHKNQLKNFNQKPYSRMLMNILTAVNISDCFNVRTQRLILNDMAELFKELCPIAYPAFAFAWLELISHHYFMPHFIKRQDSQQNQAWFQTKDLLVSCFSFLKQNMLPGQKATRALEAFYNGTIRIVLLILKDYPDFLCDFHFNFVNSLPDHCIQLRNMILAAVPRHIQAPDPLTKDLRLDIHSEVKEPRILSNYEAYLQKVGLKDDLDTYFKTKKAAIIQEICTKMMEKSETIGGKAVPSAFVINAVVLYVTQQYLKDRRTKDENYSYNELFQQIAEKLNEPSRIMLLDSIVNELRYPNTHTYSSCLLLNSLFVTSDSVIKEQIQRILFERLQSHRPHPWGLSINFRELVQNRFYGFMNNPFMNQNKTVSLLFQNRLQSFQILLEEQYQNKQQQTQQRPHLE